MSAAITDESCAPVKPDHYWNVNDEVSRDEELSEVWTRDSERT